MNIIPRYSSDKLQNLSRGLKTAGHKHMGKNVVLLQLFHLFICFWKDGKYFFFIFIFFGCRQNFLVTAAK